MTLDELRATVADKQSKGHRYMLMVITRKSSPKGQFVQVRGLGKGRVVADEYAPDGSIRIFADFEVETVAKNLAKHDARK